MIECICIDDSYRPNEIPLSKWVKAGDKYHVIYTVRVLPQNIIGVHLSEINLTENELPYEYFNINRFAFERDTLKDLMQLIQDCSEIDISMDELFNQTKIKSNESLSNDGEGFGSSRD